MVCIDNCSKCEDSIDIDNEICYYDDNGKLLCVDCKNKQNKMETQQEKTDRIHDTGLVSESELKEQNNKPKMRTFKNSIGCSMSFDESISEEQIKERLSFMGDDWEEVEN